eukprot:1342086-Alexandrium_andersonii.AAC.1
MPWWCTQQRKSSSRRGKSCSTTKSTAPRSTFSVTSWTAPLGGPWTTATGPSRLRSTRCAS